MVILRTKQEDLLAALQAVAGIVERRQTMPILGNVLLNKQDQGMQLTTSDLEVQLRRMAQLGGDAGEFATTAPVHKLIAILRTVPAGQEVSLESRDARLLLRSGKSRFTLQALPPEDFPLMQEASTFEASLEVPQATLKYLLDRVAFAMAVHDIRYYLNGVLFVADGDRLSLVATDGHRLAFASAALPVSGTRQEVILPRKTVVELQRLLADGGAVAEGKTGPVLSMQFSSNQAKFRFDGMEFVTKLVEGKFPDYERVIPRDYSNQIRLGRAALLASLQRAAILTSEKFKGVRLAFDHDLLRIVASNAEQEEAVDELDIDYAGEPLEMGFNVTYLIDVLSNVDDEMIDMALRDTGSSALVTVPSDEQFRYVVMPMRI